MQISIKDGDKKTLRSYFKACREEYVEKSADRDFEALFLKTFQAFIHEQNFVLENKVIAAYWPFGCEASPLKIIEWLKSANDFVTVVLPKMMEGTMHFVLYDTYRSLCKNNFNFCEPLSSRGILPDILIIPLLAFDSEGHRLGYGQGHYDKFIARMRAMKEPYLMGLAYACQQASTLPCEAHDQKLDAVLMPDTYILFKAFEK